MNRFYESSKIAEYYIKYRPCYGKEVAQCVMNFHTKNQQVCPRQTIKLDMMVDVGCGSGQLANAFQPYFEKILGIDVSIEQLKQARLQNKFKNIDYVQGSAENIPVDDESVDLIVAGAAAHWFDLDKFFDEVKRTLKPSGCFALLFYDYPQLSLISDSTNQSETASNIFKHAVANYTKDPFQKHVHLDVICSRFAELFAKIPFANKQRDDSLHGYVKWSVNDACGFVKSVQTYQLFMEEEIERLKSNSISVTESALSSIDPAFKLSRELQKLWNIPDELLSQKTFIADFSYIILLAKP